MSIWSVVAIPLSRYHTQHHRTGYWSNLYLHPLYSRTPPFDVTRFQRKLTYSLVLGAFSNYFSALSRINVVRSFKELQSDLFPLSDLLPFDVALIDTIFDQAMFWFKLDVRIWKPYLYKRVTPTNVYASIDDPIVDIWCVKFIV